MKSNVKGKGYSDFLDDLSGFYHDKEEAKEKKPVGIRLKEIREMQGLSIEELAHNSGFEKKRIEMIDTSASFFILFFPDNVFNNWLCLQLVHTLEICIFMQFFYLNYK